MPSHLLRPPEGMHRGIHPEGLGYPGRGDHVPVAERRSRCLGVFHGDSLRVALNWATDSGGREKSRFSRSWLPYRSLKCWIVSPGHIQFLSRSARVNAIFLAFVFSKKGDCPACAAGITWFRSCQCLPRGTGTTGGGSRGTHPWPAPASSACTRIGCISASSRPYSA